MARKSPHHEYVDYLAEDLRRGEVSRRDFVRWASVLGVSLPSISALLAACSPASAPQSTTGGATSGSQGGTTAPSGPKKGGTLRFTTTSAKELAPHRLTSGGGIDIVQCSIDYLAEADKDGVLKPSLATSWTPSADAKSWTIKLRQGVKFFNGSVMTADDVVASWKRLVDPNSGSTARSALNFLQGNNIEKRDDSTVVFNLDRAVADFPYYLFTYQAAILPKNWAGDWVADPQGTGPFKMTKYTPEQSATFVKNPEYWQPNLPNLDGVEVRIWGDATGEISSILGGSSDMISRLPFDVIETVVKAGGINVLESKSGAYDVIAMRTDMKPFDDKRVRQAFALALNRSDVVKTVLAGHGKEQNDHPVAAVFPEWFDNGIRKQDIAKAKELLAAAGASGLSFELTTHNGLAQLQTFGVTAKEMLAQAGGTLNLKIETSQVYFDHWTDVPVGLTEWAHRATATQLLNLAYRSGVPWNCAKWSNATFDKALTDLDGEVDLAKRKSLMKTIEETMTEETPVIISYNRNGLRGVRNNVKDLTFTSNRQVDLATAWLDK